MPCRLWSMARAPQMRERRSLDVEAMWVAAVANNGALREALVRVLGEEMHVKLNLPRGLGLINVHSFYHTSEWPHIAVGTLNQSPSPAAWPGPHWPICPLRWGYRSIPS
eukprot:7918195-Pyramimonas_sp.AAC.1